MTPTPSVARKSDTAGNRAALNTDALGAPLRGASRFHAVLGTRWHPSPVRERVKVSAVSLAFWAVARHTLAVVLVVGVVFPQWKIREMQEEDPGAPRLLPGAPCQHSVTPSRRLDCFRQSVILGWQRVATNHQEPSH